MSDEHADVQKLVVENRVVSGGHHARAAAVVSRESGLVFGVPPREVPPSGLFDAILPVVGEVAEVVAP